LRGRCVIVQEKGAAALEDPSVTRAIDIPSLLTDAMPENDSLIMGIEAISCRRTIIFVVIDSGCRNDATSRYFLGGSGLRKGSAY
jgi:hypothetical protein